MDISGVTPDKFKGVMKNWPTGVAVAVARYNNQLYGSTISSFNSVSLTPPLISFCLNKHNNSFKGFFCSSKITISTLAEGQQEIAEIFATKQIDKFAMVDYYKSKLFSLPLISGAVCSLEGEILHKYEGGDHIIFVTKILDCSTDNKLKPLIYLARGYKGVV